MQIKIVLKEISSGIPCYLIIRRNGDNNIFILELRTSIARETFLVVEVISF